MEVHSESLAFGTLPSRLNFPDHCVVAIIKGTFDLVPDGVMRLSQAQAELSGDLPYPDYAEAAAVGGDAGAPRYPSDFVPPKPAAEVMVVGHAHAPNGESVMEQSVAFELGPIRRALHVTGDRARTGWLGSPSAPLAFQRLELRYERAKHSPHNPVGAGGPGPSKAGAPYPLAFPNVTYPPGLASGDALPAGFGPLSTSWRYHQSMLGRYGGNYRKERWPWMPKDFDDHYWNSAPPAQQFPQPLAGDERLIVVGMHAEHQRLETRLPGLSPRCFLNYYPSEPYEILDEDQALAEGEFKEVDLTLDTVWVDMDALRAVLVWRGWLPVADSDCDEVTHAYVTLDGAQAEPSTARLGLLAAVEGERQEAEGLDVAPSPAAESSEGEAKAFEAETEAAQQRQSETAEAERRRVHEVMKEAFAKEGIPQAATAPLFALLAQDRETLRKQLTEFTRQQREAKPGFTTGLDPANRQRLIDEGHSAEFVDGFFGEIGGMLDAFANETPTAVPAGEEAETAAKPRTEAEAHLERVRLGEMVAAQAAARGADPAFVAEVLAIFTMDRPQLKAAYQSQIALLRAQSTDPLTRAMALDSTRKAILDGVRKLDLEPEDAAAVQAFARATIDTAILPELEREEGEPKEETSQEEERTPLDASKAVDKATQEGNLDGDNLTDVSLTGLTLMGVSFLGTQASGVDFSDSDLTGASFPDANLRKAKFVDANLSQAVFENTDLQGADFSQADLTGALFVNCRLARACFKQAQLEEVQMTDCDLSGINAVEVKGAHASLNACDLTEAQLSHAHLPNVDFSESTLERAQLDHANLRAASLTKVQGKQANFHQAILTEAQGGNQSDWQGARFRKIDANESVWDRARLVEADFTGASLDNALFARSLAHKATFAGASLRWSSFSKANVTDASFAHANLFESTFARARVNGASFTNANLYGTEFWEAGTEGVTSDGANLDRSQLADSRK